jgi:hypothetical protein
MIGSCGGPGGNGRVRRLRTKNIPNKVIQKSKDAACVSIWPIMLSPLRLVATIANSDRCDDSNFDALQVAF